MPTWSSSAVACRFAVAPRTPRDHNGACTLSSALSDGSRLNDWNTIPTVCRRYSCNALPRSVVTSMPPTRIEPAVGRRIDASADSNVVFPHPLAPSSSTSSPSLTTTLR
jgi:hypothetical protein